MARRAPRQAGKPASRRGTHLASSRWRAGQREKPFPGPQSRTSPAGGRGGRWRAQKPPVYGETALATYEWLDSIATDHVVDLGLSNTKLGSPPTECTRDEPSAPWLSAVHLDAWSMHAGKASLGKASEGGLELPGLVGSSLLGWMAAVGIARLTSCRLSWRRKGPRWIAVLDTDMTHDELAELLYGRTRDNPYGTSSDKNLTGTTVEEWLSWPDEWSIASHYQTKNGLRKSRLLSCVSSRGSPGCS